MVIQKGKSFEIHGSSSFCDRQRNIFRVLEREELNVNLPSADNEISERSEQKIQRRSRRQTRVFLGQESLFKVPDSPPRVRRMPDYQRNPNRWTKYSLGDVPASAMSNESNTAAALEFFRTRRESPTSDTQPSRGNRRQRIPSPDPPEDICVANRMSGAARVDFGEMNAPEEDNAPPERSVYKNNKFVMPEYVVGEKKIKKKEKRDKPEIGKQLLLSHLQDVADDHDDSNDAEII